MTKYALFSTQGDAENDNTPQNWQELYVEGGDSYLCITLNTEKHFVILRYAIPSLCHLQIVRRAHIIYNIFDEFLQPNRLIMWFLLAQSIDVRLKINPFLEYPLQHLNWKKA